MDEVISKSLSIGVMIFGILLMIGGMTRDPLAFASRPFQWLSRLLTRATQGIVDFVLSGVIAFCRRFPVMAIIILIITIAVIALVHAGFF